MSLSIPLVPRQEQGTHGRIRVSAIQSTTELTSVIAAAGVTVCTIQADLMCIAGSRRATGLSIIGVEISCFNGL
jgi:hypothetical protein